MRLVSHLLINKLSLYSASGRISSLRSSPQCWLSNYSVAEMFLLPEGRQLPSTFKKKSQLRETREENEVSTQRKEDRRDFTWSKGWQRDIKGKGRERVESKMYQTENAELGRRVRRETTPALSSKLTGYSSLSSFPLSSLPPTSESTISWEHGTYFLCLPRLPLC